MNGPRLEKLEVLGFRSINDIVDIRLDAPMVLVHGHNGAGKTSLLSALELALTGSVPSLERIDKGYRKQLVNYDAGIGSVRVQASGLEDQFDGTGIALSRTTSRTPGALSAELAQFYSERCYLPQTTLSQLLSIYGGDDGSIDTPLSQFAAELLGLDRLDALQRGLQPARDARNVRPLVPTYRTLEDRQAALADELKSIEASLRNARESETKLTGEMEAIVSRQKELKLSAAEHTDDFVRGAVAKLDDLTRRAAELRRSAERIEAARAGRDQNAVTTAARAADQDAALWRKEHAARIERLFASSSAHLSEVPSGITAGVDADVRQVADELSRLSEVALATISETASAQLRSKEIEDNSLASKTKIEDLDRSIEALGRSAPDLAEALSNIIPHIHDDECPVCRRDYAEVSDIDLAAAVQQRLNAMTAVASQLAEQTRERSHLSRSLASLQRERDILEARLPSADERLRNQAAATSLDALVAEATELNATAAAGAAILARQADALRALEGWSRADVELEILVADIDTLQKEGAFETNPFEEAPTRLDEAVAHIETRRAAMSARLADIDELSRLRAQLTRLRSEVEEIQRRRDLRAEARRRADEAFRNAGAIRRSANRLADAAAAARSRVIAEVFNDRLNHLWRDLFVRLAPNEEFVPSFDVPPGRAGRVRPVLKTVHRSGEDGGTPGVMLSSGNLNTAALTLFLALHLSVQPKLPWLVLDDPVQSMDDVHIAHFAALLRTLSKEHGRQIIVAVHDRALFDYLALEMSPAFRTDELITVVLERSSGGLTRFVTERLGYVERPRIVASAA